MKLYRVATTVFSSPGISSRLEALGHVHSLIKLHGLNKRLAWKALVTFSEDMRHYSGDRRGDVKESASTRLMMLRNSQSSESEAEYRRGRRSDIENLTTFRLGLSSHVEAREPILPLNMNFLNQLINWHLIGAITCACITWFRTVLTYCYIWSSL